MNQSEFLDFLAQEIHLLNIEILVCFFLLIFVSLIAILLFALRLKRMY